MFPTYTPTHSVPRWPVPMNQAEEAFSGRNGPSRKNIYLSSAYMRDILNQSRARIDRSKELKNYREGIETFFNRK